MLIYGSSTLVVSFDWLPRKNSTYIYYMGGGGQSTPRVHLEGGGGAHPMGKLGVMMSP